MTGVLFALGACQEVTQPLPGGRGGVITGLVVGSEPIRGATIEVWALDAAGARASIPRHTVQSDLEGRYHIEVTGALVPPFLVTARGGVTTEYWSDEEVALADQIHLQAVVTRDWLKRQTAPEVPLVLSPLTTVAAALGAQRAALGEGSDYSAAMGEAHALLDGHFELDLRRTLPAREQDALPTEEVRYALALAGLSGIVHEAARRTGRPIGSMNIAMLTAALVEDAHGPGARLDGDGPAGPVALGTCGDQCRLPADALRGALARAVAGDFLVSTANDTSLDFGDVSEYLLRLSGRSLPALFGDGAPGELDTLPPVLEILSSPLYDESRDRIAFDQARTLSHVHDTLATIDLARGFGDTCPVVYKHADLLGSSDSNPLRWSVAVRDDLVGVSPIGLTASIRPMNSAAPGIELVGSPAEAIEGGFTFDVTATGAELAALAAPEGTYQVELRVQDWLGNEAAPLTGCWQHVTLAAPLWAGSFDVALGPGSFDEMRLENDNLAPVLRGEEAPVLARLAVENNTDADVYLTLSIDELVGRYTATWTSSRAFLQESSTPDNCLGDGRCNTASPPGTLVFPSSPRPVPSSFAALRMIELSTGLEARCAECDAGEFRLVRRGRYQVQVVAADLGFLVTQDVPLQLIDDISVGPLGSATKLTGVNDGEYVECTASFDAVRCLTSRRYQLYRALTDAAVEIDRLVLSGRVSPTPTGVLRVPQPPLEPDASTLSIPQSASFSWTTQDANLPDPG